MAKYHTDLNTNGIISWFNIHGEMITKRHKIGKSGFLNFWTTQFEGTSLEEEAQKAEITNHKKIGANWFDGKELTTNCEPGLYSIPPYACSECISDGSIDDDTLSYETKNHPQPFIPIDPDFQYTIRCFSCNKESDYSNGELDDTPTGIAIHAIHEYENM